MGPRTDTARLAGASLLAIAALLASPPLRADLPPAPAPVPADEAARPQITVGATAGAAGVGLGRVWSETDFQLGLHGDVLFGRAGPRDFGAGPYVELLTIGFEEVQFGGGASLLLPLTESFPLVLSAGGFLRAGDPPGVAPGLAGQLFWGSRSYNFDSDYGLAAGVVAEVRHSFGAAQENAVVIGAQVDLAMLALPFLFLGNALRGGSPDTAPVRRSDAGGRSAAF
jgi:hypothetical protein